MNCSNCQKAITSESSATRCDSCQGRLHVHCVGLTERDFVTTRQKSKSIKFVCNSCNGNMSHHKDIQALLSAMKAEFVALVDKLREDFCEQLRSLREDLAGQRPSDSNESIFEEVHQELVDRQSRKKNLIMFGVSEPVPSGGQSPAASDHVTVTNITKCLIPTNADTFKVSRLGRFNTANDRGRPIKVVFDSDECVIRYIREAKKLKNFPAYSNLRISYDRTPRQIKYYNQLKLQLEQRTANGEPDLRIRYTNGTPRIVKNTLN